MKWVRWYRGSCEDGKFRYAARVSRVTVRDIIALWAVMLEDAARMDHRGVCLLSRSFMSAVLDLEDEQVLAMLEAMQDAGLIVIEDYSVTLCKFKERQFDSDADLTARDRKASQRARERAKRHGDVTRDVSPPESDTESEKSSKYRFAGKTIRLTDSLYYAWKDNFPDIDLDATLRELDAMITMEGGSGSPFRVSALLKHRNEKAKSKRGKLLAPYKPFTPDPPEKEKPPQAERDAQIEKWKRMRGTNALVRRDDEGEEGTTSELAPKEARVPDVLPALQAMDYATEDQA